MKNHSVPQILAQAFRDVDFRQLLKKILMLNACLFSLFFLLAAPYELTQVRAVNGWPGQAARVLAVERRVSDFHKSGGTYWRYDLQLQDSGERVTTADVRPGDLPFTVLLWSTSDRDAARYHPGDIVQVYRAPSGGKIYLERGSYGFMTGIWLLSLAFWGWIIARRRLRGT